LLESRINDRAHDNISFLVDFLAYPARGFVHFVQRQIVTAGDRNQNGRAARIAFHSASVRRRLAMPG
jgi:hypothetical protein